MRPWLVVVVILVVVVVLLVFVVVVAVGLIVVTLWGQSLNLKFSTGGLDLLTTQSIIKTLEQLGQTRRMFQYSIWPQI